MTDSQPDFSAIFRSTFAELQRPLVYRVRSGPHTLHDLTFMSSLVHDARVRSPVAPCAEGVMVVELERDRWELWHRGSPSGSALVSTRSTLTIGGVEQVRNEREVEGGERSLDYLWIGREYREGKSFPLSLVGVDWEVTLQLQGEDWSIVLEDAGE